VRVDASSRGTDFPTSRSMLDGLSQALQCVQTECGHKALNLLGRSQLSTVHQFWGKERSNRVCGCFRCSGSQSYGGYYIILSCRTNTCLSLRSCTVGISRKSFENNPKNKHLELPTTVAQIITIQFYDSSKRRPYTGRQTCSRGLAFTT
jgi:hypothetical protein